MAAAMAVKSWDTTMQDASIAAKTKAGNDARPLPAAGDFTIDGEFVEFYADGEEAPCEQLRLRIDQVDEDGDVYFSLYCDGTHHDGHGALSDTEHAFPMVAVDLDDWKAGRLVPFAVVREAAFAHAGLTDPDVEDEGDGEP